MGTISDDFLIIKQNRVNTFEYVPARSDSVRTATPRYSTLPRNQATVLAAPGTTTVQLDWLTVPESISVQYGLENLPSSQLRFNSDTGLLTIIWPAEWSPLPRELRIQWHYRPLPIPRQYRHPLLLYNGEPSSDEMPATMTTAAANTPGAGITSALEGGGSITRGIAVGSNQDLSLESGLRFDLSGRLTDDVFISASLTDRSTFIQPDGTTQNLRSFDQVYVRITTPRIVAQFGDIDASYTHSNLVRLSRRLQGGDVRLQHRQNGQSSATLAVVTGTFRVMEFNGQTGVQGPYRLTNSSGETFITVAAGTEKVYLDGQLLGRGEENDYIIDYSIGEIYFTNKRILRSSHRIRVEYQYLGSGFTRTIVAAQTDYNELAGGKLSVGATFIRQADNVTFDDFTGLSADEIATLQQAGNINEQLLVSGADSVGYRPDSPYILYARKDTLIGTQVYTIFRYEPFNEQSHFRVRFSQVGEGNGSYRRSTQTINGIIYEWVGPGMGSYEPLRSIRPPVLQQVLALRAGARPISGLALTAEWGVSQQQTNRYSISSADPSQKIQTGAQWDLTISETTKVQTRADLEYRGGDFVTFDPVRDIEFDRKWDISDSNRQDELRLQAGIGVSSVEQLEAGWQYEQLKRDTQKGHRNDFHASALLLNRWHLSARAGHLNSKRDSLGSTDWFNTFANTGIEIPLMGVVLQPGYTLESEYRRAVTPEGQLIADSFSFVEHTPALQLSGTNSWEVSIRYAYRRESMAQAGDIVLMSTAHAPEMRVRLQSGRWLTSENSLAYRKEDITPEFVASAGASSATGMAIRSAQDVNLLAGSIQSSFLYDASTQVRSVFQETYLEVGPEFGQYVWVDVNNDGIPQIDEFFPEQTPGEGTYIQQLLPSDELVPVVVLQARWNLEVEPSSYFSSNALRGIRYTSDISLSEQNETRNLTDVYLLRAGSLRNELTTIRGSIRWNQRLELFRHLRRVDTELSTSQAESMNRLSAGTEFSNLRRYNVLSRYRFEREVTGQMRLEWKESTRRSTDLASRNYEIQGWMVEPAAHFSEISNLRSSIYLQFGARSDRYQNPEVRIRYEKVRLEIASSLTRDLQFSVQGEYRSMRLNRETGALAAFELTDGAGDGRSVMWLSQLRWLHSETITTTLDYDGRTTQVAGVIHRIRLRVTARF